MEWVITLFNQLLEFLYNLLVSLIDMLKDIFFWAIETVMDAASVLLSWVFSLFAPVDIGQYMSAIPPNVAWIMSAVGLPQCLTIILSAITVRMLLQLIPFTRLGS